MHLQPCFEWFSTAWVVCGLFCRVLWLIDIQHPTHRSPMDEQNFPGDCNYPMKCCVYRVSTAKTLITLITLFTRWSFNALEQYFTWIMLWCLFLDGFVHGNRLGLASWTAFDILYVCMCNLFIVGAGCCGRAQIWLGLGARRQALNAASRWKKVFTSLLSSDGCVSRGWFHFFCFVSQTVLC